MPLFRRVCACLAALVAVAALAGCSPPHRVFCFGEGGQVDECVSIGHRGTP